MDGQTAKRPKRNAKACFAEKGEVEEEMEGEGGWEGRRKGG